MNKEYFRHTVLFWLKDPNNENHKTTFEASLKQFIDDSNYVQNSHIGTAVNSKRNVVDSSFTYCLSVSFISKEEQDKYQDEPAHLKFIDECSKLWEKVLVYDSVTI